MGLVDAHEGRQLLHVRLLLLVLAHLYLLLVGDELAEGVVVAAVVGEATPVQPHGVSAHRVEEVLSG